MNMLGPEIALRAVGTALAGISVAFATYMLAYGGAGARVNGLEYLAIFAQPRGPAPRALEHFPLILHRILRRRDSWRILVG
jgi:hypothetical protein